MNHGRLLVRLTRMHRVLVLALTGCWTTASPPTAKGTPPAIIVPASKTEPSPFASTWIEFATASATIERASFRDLDMLVPRLREAGNRRFRIVAYDVVLWSERAASIREYLVAKGIAETRLSVVGQEVVDTDDIRIELVPIAGEP